jgi:hypothetical protein
MEVIDQFDMWIALKQENNPLPPLSNEQDAW